MDREAAARAAAEGESAPELSKEKLEAVYDAKREELQKHLAALVRGDPRLPLPPPPRDHTHDARTQPVTVHGLRRPSTPVHPLRVLFSTSASLGLFS